MEQRTIAEGQRLSDERIDELIALEVEVTKGRWNAYGGAISASFAHNGLLVGEFLNDEDAEYMAAAREALPLALAEVKEQRGLLREALSDLRAFYIRHPNWDEHAFCECCGTWDRHEESCLIARIKEAGAAARFAAELEAGEKTK